MVIKQLSVFIENKTGNLIELTRILGESGINMTAFTLAETSDFGILRVIVSDPERAYRVLRENRFAVSLTDVICLQVTNTPGSLAHALQILSSEGVFIEYMYAFSLGEKACVVIRPNLQEEALKALQRHQIQLLSI